LITSALQRSICSGVASPVVAEQDGTVSVHHQCQLRRWDVTLIG